MTTSAPGASWAANCTVMVPLSASFSQALTRPISAFPAGAVASDWVCNAASIQAPPGEGTTRTITRCRWGVAPVSGPPGGSTHADSITPGRPAGVEKSGASARTIGHSAATVASVCRHSACPFATGRNIPPGASASAPSEAGAVETASSPTARAAPQRRSHAVASQAQRRTQVLRLAATVWVRSLGVMSGRRLSQPHRPAASRVSPG